MIQLSSVSGNKFYLNHDLIFKIERNYDTLITLTDQKKLRVKNSPEEIVEKVAVFKGKISCHRLEVEKNEA